MSAHNFTLTDIDGNELDLADYRGKVLLIVNVASRCGLTPHYTGLQALHERLADQGLVIIGAPCNQFGAQEPGSAGEIKEFCSVRYGVTFPLTAKLEVHGPGRDPLYAWLCDQQSGPDGAGDIAWNFAKFVIGKDGALVARFAPTTKPDDPELLAAIQGALAG